MQIINSVRSKSFSGRRIAIIIGSIFLAVMIFGGVILVIRGIQQRTSRASGSAHISFLPSSLTLTTPKTVDLIVNSTSAVGFARVDFTFDKNKMQLASDPQFISPINKTISVTSRANANSTGKVSLVIGLDPDSIPQAPVGEFSLARLQFTPVTPLSTSTTEVVIDVENSQIVDFDPSELLLSAEALTITFDQSTPTPTPTGSANPTVTPTNPPSTSGPSASPTPTASSGPTATPCSTYGDIDGNNEVDPNDYILFLKNYRTEPPFANPEADINHDNKVTLLDYIVLFENFGRQCQ